MSSSSASIMPSSSCLISSSVSEKSYSSAGFLLSENESSMSVFTGYSRSSFMLSMESEMRSFLSITAINVKIAAAVANAPMM